MLLGLLIEHEDWLTKHGFNPCVAVRELRSKQRPVWERWLSIAGAVAIGCGPAPMLLLVTHDLFVGRFRPSDAQSVFNVLNVVAAWVLTVLIAVPAAIGIVSEREKRTLEPLRATALQPGDVVGGKIIGAMAAGLPILGLVIPMQLWAVVLGGVGVFQWLGMLLLLIGVALWAACVGTAVSAASANTVSAIVVAFVVMGALGAAPVALEQWMFYHSEWGNRGDRWVGVVVPVAALVIAVLWVPVAHCAFGKVGQPLPRRLPAIAASVALVLVTAGLLSASIVQTYPREGGWLLAAFYPPTGVAISASTVSEPLSGEEVSARGALSVWLLCFLLSLLGSGFFRSVATFAYERRAR